jgi:hypothetical protein
MREETMNGQDAIEYHASRARIELDLGLTADALAASRAHLQLAALHMNRMRELTGASEPHKPSLTA